MGFFSRQKIFDNRPADGTTRFSWIRTRRRRSFSGLAKLPGVVVISAWSPRTQHPLHTYISEGARDLFGVSPEEIISNPQALFSCHSHDYSAKFKERLLAASKSLTLWDVEASIVARDGRKKYTTR